MKRNLAITALLGLVLLLGLAGCASDQVRRNGYKMLGSYAVTVETGADIAENPATPTNIVDGIKEAKDIASPTVKALHDNLRLYADLQDQIQGIKDAGGEPSIILLQQSAAALEALRQSMAATAPRIAEIIAAVNRSF